MLKEDLEQRKLFNKKYKITEQAIQKAISFKFIDNLSIEENKLIKDCIKRVLVYSMEYNDSNEVVVVSSGDRWGTEHGTEHGVNISTSTNIMQILLNKSNSFIVMCHNHPSTQTFSLEDLNLFLRFTTIDVFVVVSNLGSVEILIRDIFNTTKVKKEEDLVTKINLIYKEAHLNAETPEDYYGYALKALKLFKSIGYYRRLV